MRALDRIAVLVLLGLLTWLLVKGLNPAAARLGEARAQLEAYAAHQSALHRDVLSARAGLLNNYDSLASGLDRMAAAERTVIVNLRGDDRRRGDAALAANRARQEALTERFKSRNALLQNSLAYFALFGGRADGRAGGERVKRAVDALSSAMLNLSLDNSLASQQEVDTQIVSLAAICSGIACGPDIASLLTHGRMLRELLPETTRLVETLVRSDDEAGVRQLRQHLRAEEQAAETVSHRFRVLLYLTSLLLLHPLVRWGLQARAHRSALRRQMDLEHALAWMSTQLIAAPPDRLRLAVNEGLGKLSRALGATCGHLMLGRTGESCCWPGGVRSPTSQWPAALSRLATSSGDPELGVLHLSRGALRPDSPERQLLESMGLASCYCIFGLGGFPQANMLVFGLAEGAPSEWSIPQLAVLSAALDAISRSLEHADLEVERTRLEEQLGHARRMEIVGAFASGIAHNFNNLLGAIDGHAEMAIEEDAPAGAVHTHLAQIRLSAERGRELVHGLLTYGRRHEHLRRLVQLDLLIEESCGLARAALEPLHRVDLCTIAPGRTVCVDDTQLQQVILNLCNNAAQAMPEGGTIRVRTLVEQSSSLSDRREAADAAESVAIVVEDSGCGIEPSLLHKVFDPFFTTRPQGTGLGLSTARDIVAEQEGILSIDSEPGTGTRVTIRLPVAGSNSSPADSPHLQIIQGRGEAILLLANDDAGRLLGEDLLAALGYEPVGFTDPGMALDALESASERFDAILVGGFPLDARIETVLACARRNAPQMPRILAVARSNMHNAQALAGAGVSTIVHFPLEPREIASALRRLTPVAPPSRPAAAQA